MKHGGNIYEFNKNIIDFSSNINIFNMNDILKKLIKENFNDINIYSDIKNETTYKNVERYLLLDRKNIILSPGAINIIDFFVKHFDTVILFNPCFNEYEARAEVWNKEIINLNYDSDFKIDIELVNSLIKKSSLLILSNPNNPSSTIISYEDMIKLDELSKKGLHILIDEAFVEFCQLDYNSIDLFKNNDNVSIIRAMTKTFALPSARFAYAKVSVDLKKIYDKEALPWSVSFIQDISSYLLINSFKYIEKTKEYYKNESKRLDEEFKKFYSIKKYKNNANFYMIESNSLKSYEIYEKLLNKNILCRELGDYKNIGSNIVRLAIKDIKSNNILLRALKEIDDESYNDCSYEQ